MSEPHPMMPNEELHSLEMMDGVSWTLMVPKLDNTAELVSYVTVIPPTEFEIPAMTVANDFTNDDVYATNKKNSPVQQIASLDLPQFQ